ncbi:DUF6458 family protein [Enemella sp. A6]|uniref:DUF6458 family protein n=1 Tax=Enemella sp. A6 TaxID=3440152 RepID=UPI003EBD2D10
MGIGLGVFLLAVGAILTFAVNVDIPGVNDDMLGWILMGAGLLALILAIALRGRRRVRTTTTTDPAARGEVVEHREDRADPL